LQKEYELFKSLMLRRYPLCEICNSNNSQEIHHNLYHKHGGIYDTVCNCQAICSECREIAVDNSTTNRDQHWDKRVSEGFDMNTWNSQVPKAWRKGWGTR